MTAAFAVIRYTAAVLLLAVLLAACADAPTTKPGWRTAEFVRVQRPDGTVCWVKVPDRVTNWVKAYADMVQQCMAAGTATPRGPEVEA